VTTRNNSNNTSKSIGRLLFEFFIFRDSTPANPRFLANGTTGTDFRNVFSPILLWQLHFMLNQVVLPSLPRISGFICTFTTIILPLHPPSSHNRECRLQLQPRHEWQLTRFIRAAVRLHLIIVSYSSNWAAGDVSMFCRRRDFIVLDMAIHGTAIAAMIRSMAMGILFPHGSNVLIYDT
jgi:hypothetical protein